MDVKDEIKSEQTDTIPDATSPLGPLDPSRLRDMVVDQNVHGFGQSNSWSSDSPHMHQQVPTRPQHLQGVPMDGSHQQLPATSSAHLQQQAHHQQMQQQHQQGNMQGMPPQSPMGSPMNTPNSASLPTQPQLPMSSGAPSTPYDPSPSPYSGGHGMQQYPGQMPPPSPGGMMQPNPMQSPTAAQQQAMYQQQQQRMMQMQGASGMMPPQGGYPGYPPQNGQWGPQMGHGGGYVQNPRVMGGPGPSGMPPQRVPIQRVPYPNAGYPAGGPMPQPGQPYGAMQRPQQMVPRPGQYPPGAQPGYGYPGQPGHPQGYPPQGMHGYPPRPQVSQPMRPYMNSPQAQAMMNAQGVRFPQATPSPHHYAAGPDMRSPPLMSPNQQMVMNRGMMNGPPMRMPQAPYVGHDPNVMANITPDMCFVGCIFHLLDVEKYSTDKQDMQNIANTIKLLGGDINFGDKTFLDRFPIITHVITDAINKNQHAQQVGPPGTAPEVPPVFTAVKHGKRVVTMQWLHDACTKKRMDVPWRMCHLPSVFYEGMRPYSGKVISMSGFDADERIAIKFMVEAIGGRVTAYLAKFNHILIAKGDVCEKIEKAQEWNIPVVNLQWLIDAYMGRQVSADLPQYALGQPSMEINSTPYQLEMLNENVKSLLNAWRMPISVSRADWDNASKVKAALMSNENVYPNNKFKNAAPAPSLENIAAMDRLRLKKEQETGKKELQFRVAFSGFDEDIERTMAMKVRFLGGIVIDDPSKCTHLVSIGARRSMKLLMAIASGAYVVRAEFVLVSYGNQNWQDVFDYMIKDEEAEKQLGYNLKYSIMRARQKKVFEDVTFYITPSVDPPRDALKRLIEVAGGKVDLERPSGQHLAECIETDLPYILIGSESDARMLEHLLECHVQMYTPELVLMSVLRQEIDPLPAYRVNLANVVPMSTPTGVVVNGGGQPATVPPPPGTVPPQYIQRPPMQTPIQQQQPPGMQPIMQRPPQMVGTR